MNTRHRAAALIIRNNKLLLVKGKGYPELWTPGGKIEEGESPEGTLKRELSEETGLNMKSATFFRKYLMGNPYDKDLMSETETFLVVAEGIPKPDNEIESIIWYGKEDFMNKVYPLIKETKEGIIPDLLKEKLLK